MKPKGFHYYFFEESFVSWLLEGELSKTGTPAKKLLTLDNKNKNNRSEDSNVWFT